MSKTPYFIRNEDGTFTFLGYFAHGGVAQNFYSGRPSEVVDSSFLYRTIEAAKEALNTAPLPEGCTN